MSWNNKVVWYEGMFLRPQHFQQQDRYFESFVQARCRHLHPFDWGFSELSLDTEALRFGKVAVAAAQGILPDGTPFDIPGQDEPPQPLEIDPETRDARVFLALPVRQPEKPDVLRGASSGAGGRYLSAERDVRDSNVGSNDITRLEIGKRQLRLVLEGQDLGGVAALGLTRVLERAPSLVVQLDETYIPPCLDCAASSKLGSYITGVLGKLRQVANEQAQWVTGSRRSGEADVTDLLYLHVLNRYEPLFQHLSTLTGLHPEELYRIGQVLASELALFTTRSRRPKALPPYAHDDLSATFSPLMEELRRSLDWVKKRSSVEILLEQTEYGVYIGTPADPLLLGEADFVLAVEAEVAPETLRTELPGRLKIGARERIASLVNDRLPGVRLNVLQGAPRQLPSFTGFSYFQLERYGEEWQQLVKSGTFAFYVQGRFPGMKMKFWAIREEAGE